MYIHIPQDYIPHTKRIQQLVGAHHGYVTHISIVYITTCNTCYVQVVIQYNATHHN